MRSGRTIALWCLAWYVAIQLPILLIKDRWQTIGPAHEARKWPALRKLAVHNTERPLVLMLGSSRTCWAFQAGPLNGLPGPDGQPLRVYNFGIPATGPIHELLYLRDMLAQGIRPRLLLVEFLPPLLCAHQRGALSEENMKGFAHVSARDFMRLLPYMSRPGRRGREWVEARIAPSFAFRRQIQCEIVDWALGISPHPFSSEIDAGGWHILSPEPLPDEERTRRVQMAHEGFLPSLSNYHLSDVAAGALRDLFELCRREQIPTALVLMPESSEFRSWYSAEARSASRGLLEELSRAYDAPIIDAEKWIADEDFEDGQHVLLRGANVFTHHLWGEIERLLARKVD
ncbi:MAG TPA: hypothetical protein VJ718_05840 [Candidatus Binataceae bacterium]|nr:hypothetical protein [Candidatus Binataceae bacterium]